MTYSFAMVPYLMVLRFQFSANFADNEVCRKRCECRWLGRWCSIIGPGDLGGGRRQTKAGASLCREGTYSKCALLIHTPQHKAPKSNAPWV